MLASEVVIDLSPQEQKICLAASRGLSNADIAGQLDVLVITIDEFWRELLERTGAKTRFEAIEVWMSGSDRVPLPRPLPVPIAVLGTLSPREREVCLGAASGLTNKAIAEQLGIEQCTVDSYWRRIFERTGATGRSQAVALWVSGIITPAPRPARNEEARIA